MLLIPDRSSSLYRHHAHKAIEINCLICGDVFRTWPKLDTHLHRKHPNFIAEMSRDVEARKNEDAQILNQVFALNG